MSVLDSDWAAIALAPARAARSRRADDRTRCDRPPAGRRSGAVAGILGRRR